MNKALPKVFGWFALAGAVAGTYFEQTGKTPPGWFFTMMTLVATISHSVGGDGPLVAGPPK